MKRSSWIIWVGLKSNDKHPYESKAGEDMRPPDEEEAMWP